MLLSATLGTICRWRSGCWCRDAPCWRSLCTHNEAVLLNGGAINITDYLGMTTTLARLLKLLGIRRVAREVTTLSDLLHEDQHHLEQHAKQSMRCIASPLIACSPTSACSVPSLVMVRAGRHGALHSRVRSDLQLTDAEREVFDAIAGGRNPPAQRVRELWCIIGRRGGKIQDGRSPRRLLCLFVKHKLSGGERGMVLVISATVEQTKVVFDYMLGLHHRSLRCCARKLTARHEARSGSRTASTLPSMPTHFARCVAARLCACIFERCSYWRDDTTATPDTEVYSAVLPALITTNGMLIGISSPYRKIGLMYTKHKRFFGIDSDDTLVVQGPTLPFNKTLDPNAIAAQQQADPEAARSEWDAEFRADIATFLDDELIEAAIDHSRPLELPPVRGVTYKCFVDPAGGAVGGDAYTHRHRS